MSTVLFSLGQCVITPDAEALLASININPFELLRRHQTGDWLEMAKQDQAENHAAIKNGFRVFSVYTLTNTICVWVITEADRSVSTILLPSEY